MKKLVLLTSVLALAACGGGGTSAPIWQADTIITKDMLDSANTGQSREISTKLQTIEYVENNLETIIEGGVLSAPSIRSGRSATIDELDSGLALSDIESRYQHALEYFGVLNKVLNADINTPDKLTVKDVKIAYSLSANKKYEDLTNDDLPFIDIDHEDDETVIIIDAGFRETQITIRDNYTENDDLQEDAFKDTLADIITPEAPYKFDFSGKTFEYSDGFEPAKVVFTTTGSGNITAVDFSLADKFIDTDPNDNQLKFIAYEITWKNGDHGHHITTATEVTTDEQLRELAIKDLQEESDPEELESALAYAENLTLAEVDIEKVLYEGDLTFWGNQIGLKYSDIGNLQLMGTVISESGISTDAEISNMLIAAGDENRIIAKESLSPDSKYEFKGQAHALLTVEDNAMNDDRRVKYIDTDDATLVFDATNNTETLTMDFADWYDVEISKNSDDEITAKLSNDDNDKIDTLFQEYDTNGMVDAFMNVKYYGAGATPEESTAVFGMESYSEQENDNGNTFNKNIYVDGVFGGVK